MKRYVKTDISEKLIFYLTKITSVTLVDNAFEFSPRDHENSISITNAKKIRTDYSSMSREQLLALPKKELSSIRDVNVLRKLKVDELDLAQRVLVGKANAEYRDISTRSKVSEVIQKLKQCKSFFIWGSKKNKGFISEINEMGGEVENSDVRKIVHSLNVKDFTEFRLSYLDANWNSVMMVLEYKGDYTFKSLDENEDGVTVKGLDLYIKLDIDTEDGEGIGAVSFHHPEFKMEHPYADK